MEKIDKLDRQILEIISQNAASHSAMWQSSAVYRAPLFTNVCSG